MQKRYRVKRDYRAFYGDEAVALVKGSEVEMDEDMAAWIMRDSPGTLTEIKPKARARRAPESDRQVKEVETR
jgi:hypothetical protein